MTVSLTDLMQTSPEELAQLQYEALKTHVLNRLDDVRKAIKTDNFADVRKNLAASPAGDGYGCDNSYIDFSYDTDPMDIADAIARLEDLKKPVTAKGKIK